MARSTDRAPFKLLTFGQTFDLRLHANYPAEFGLASPIQSVLRCYSSDFAVTGSENRFALEKVLTTEVSTLLKCRSR